MLDFFASAVQFSGLRTTLSPQQQQPYSSDFLHHVTKETHQLTNNEVLF